MTHQIPQEAEEARWSDLRLEAELTLLSYQLGGHRLDRGRDRDIVFRGELHRHIQAAIDGIVARGGEPEREAVQSALASEPFAEAALAILDRLPDVPFDRQTAAALDLRFQYLIRLIESIARREGEVMELVSAADLEPRAIDWLWDGWLARGKLHLLGGQVGAGKTTLALSLAAAITSGNPLPDGSTPTPGSVLYWSADDNVAETLLPRFIAAGGRRDKLAFVSGVTDAEGRFRPFDPAQDLAALGHAMDRIADLKLLVIDPIDPLFGDRNARACLAALREIAVWRNVAVLGVGYFSRSNFAAEPLDRIAVPLAALCMPRIVMAMGKDPGGQPLLVRAKSSIGPDGDGFAFDLEVASVASGIPAARIAWGEAVQGAARELLPAKDPAAPEAPARLIAEAWLAIRLERPSRVRDVENAARESGLAWRTVERAKKSLGVVTTREGPDGYLWRLPATPSS
jgi:putative DNA primase/helicase